MSHSYGQVEKTRHEGRPRGHKRVCLELASRTITMNLPLWQLAMKEAKQEALQWRCVVSDRTTEVPASFQGDPLSDAGFKLIMIFWEEKKH